MALMAVAVSTAQRRPLRTAARQSVTATVTMQSDTIRHLSVSDSLLQTPSSLFLHHGKTAPIPNYYFLPAVYDRFQFYTPDTIAPQEWKYADRHTDWLTSAIAVEQRMRNTLQRYMVANPQDVKYNVATLPRAPGKLQQDTDIRNKKVPTREIPVTSDAAQLHEVRYGRNNWLHTFEGSLQFSQAYISPNWYQGGTNNLNLIGQVRWFVELNQAFHPNLLFNFDIRYKLGANNAPDDSLHRYNISEDLLQINTTFGYKALRHWYYSLNAMFKTQLMNSYKKNTRELAAAFLSPGELNMGVGMTYNYANRPKTFTIDVSLAPFSYNLKTCTSMKMPHEAYGIQPDARSVSTIGSNAEMRLRWQMAGNITLNSRIFAFTDYDYLQADWETTLQFAVNRFLSTQLYVHARYDSRTARVADSDWHKIQLKEILSLGFAYKFDVK